MEKQRSSWLLAPIFGAVLFILLYIIAALSYPGGSQFDKNSTGFSWTNNYWCNLLNEDAINGHLNPARPFAIAGLLVLCVTLGLFWFLFSRHTGLSKIHKACIRVGGILAMLAALFLFTVSTTTLSPILLHSSD